MVNTIGRVPDAGNGSPRDAAQGPPDRITHASTDRPVEHFRMGGNYS